MARPDDGGLDAHFNPLMRRIAALNIPFVSSVRGAAAGIGAALALSADIIVASETAFFLEAFRHVGLVPDGGSTFLLTRAVGRVRALEMMMLGGRLSAEQALGWGLVTRMVADEALESTTETICRDLAAGAPLALGTIRRLVWQTLDADFPRSLDLERDAQRQMLRSADFREGVAAFTARRQPKFQGK